MYEVYIALYKPDNEIQQNTAVLCEVAQHNSPYWYGAMYFRAGELQRVQVKRSPRRDLVGSSVLVFEAFRYMRFLKMYHVVNQLN